MLENKAIVRCIEKKDNNYVKVKDNIFRRVR